MQSVLQQESEHITRKLAAAEILMEDWSASEHTASTEGEEIGPQEEDQFPDVVLRAVGALQGPSKPGKIKDWIFANLADDPETIRKAQHPYFYTVLMRHAQKGKLIKEGNGYSLPTSSPQGETGADDPGSNPA